MRFERKSPCKINLLLNILGLRSDGFHELETILYPVGVFDTLTFESSNKTEIELTCNLPELPAGSSNLVHRAADLFLKRCGLNQGVKIHLEKQIPIAAGLGGGSSNAANTLFGMNELFGGPLSIVQLAAVAAQLGSDVPFFLQSNPALGTGRGERIEPLAFFPALAGRVLFLVHPGFGIATAWAYQELARFPKAQQGDSGRARHLITMLQAGDLKSAATALYNSLEAPAFHKYPILGLYQEFLKERGAVATLMSGSGSTTFAVFETVESAERGAEDFRKRFGRGGWMTSVML